MNYINFCLNYPAVNFYLKEDKTKPFKFDIKDFEISNLAAYIAENKKGIEYHEIMQGIDKNIEGVNVSTDEDLSDTTDRKNDAEVEVNYVKNDI